MTGPELRSLLIDQRIIRGSHILPSLDACNRLAGRIGEFAERHLGYLVQSADPHGEAIQRAMDDLVAKLAEARPVLVERRGKADIAALDRLAEAAALARPLAWSWGPLAIAHCRWHGHAAELADAFRVAMRSTNPDLELGLSNDGPLVRFLAFVIPQITGEEPSMDAIARHLQRRR